MQRLLEQLRRERYVIESTDTPAQRAYKQGWLDCSTNFERAIDELRTRDALAEMRDAKAIDLRLRDELIWGPPSGAILPAPTAEARQPTGSPQVGAFMGDCVPLKDHAALANTHGNSHADALETALAAPTFDLGGES